MINLCTYIVVAEILLYFLYFFTLIAYTLIALVNDINKVVSRWFSQFRDRRSKPELSSETVSSRYERRQEGKRQEEKGKKK